LPILEHKEEKSGTCTLRRKRVLESLLLKQEPSCEFNDKNMDFEENVLK
jgi:hypothetical protein